jgi:hypothetical protein
VHRSHSGAFTSRIPGVHRSHPGVHRSHSGRSPVASRACTGLTPGVHWSHPFGMRRNAVGEQPIRLRNSRVK